MRKFFFLVFIFLRVFPGLFEALRKNFLEKPFAVEKVISQNFMFDFKHAFL